MLQALIASGVLKQLLKWVAIGTGIYVVYKYLANKKEEHDYMKNDKDAAASLETGQAVSLRIAMNPSGNTSLFDVDGTNRTAILNIAREIKNLQGVIDAYNKRFSGSLLHHLELELGAEDYQKFLALSGGASNSTVDYQSVKNGVKANCFVRTSKQANARSSPKKPGFFEKDNVLKLFQPLSIIGSTTGKTDYDTDNDIIFVEVRMTNKRNMQVKFWVAKSQIEIIANEEIKRRRLAGEKFVVEQLDGLGSLPKPELATLRAGTIIYGEDFKPVDKVRDRMSLGVPNMFAKIGDITLVRFITADDCRRWVNVKDVFMFLPKTA